MKFIYNIPTDEEATFLERPNRFIARVKRDNGEEVICHVHDSGRLPELLYEGNRVKIRKASNPERKTGKCFGNCPERRSQSIIHHSG